MKSHLTITGLLISILAITPSHAQTTATDNPLKNRLDSLVDQSARRYFSDSAAVGLSIGIIQNGKTFFYNYGETKKGNGKLPSNKTIYEIGSITKTFTGILLAQAVLDKKINLDDDIRKYLPGAYPNLEYKGQPIRVVDLSNHTARVTRIFPNFFNRAGYEPLDPYATYTREMLYEGLHQMKMDTFPGKAHSYSNMGMGLLGCILEDVYHQKYVDLLSTFITKPLKMNDTKVDISGMQDVATPHNAQRVPVPLWDISLLPAIGALRSNTSDLVKYIRANNTQITGSIPLSHQLTFGTEQDGLGLNWFIHTTPQGAKVIEHNGGTGGSRSSLQCFPDSDAGFVILTNSVANRNPLEKEIALIVTEQTR